MAELGLDSATSHPDEPPRDGTPRSIDPGAAPPVDPADLSARLADLEGRFEAVAASVEPVLAAMRSPGRPPSYHALFALGECHRRFLRIRQELLRLIAQVPHPTPPSPRVESLEEARALLGLLGHPAPARPEPAASQPDHPPVALVSPNQATIAPDDIPPEEPTSVEPTEAMVGPTTAIAEPLVDVPRHEALVSDLAPVLAPLSVPDLEPAPWRPTDDESAMDATPWPPGVLESPNGAVVDSSPGEAPPSGPDSRDEARFAPEPTVPDPEPEHRDPRRDEALGILARAARLRLKDGSMPPELGLCLDDVKTLRDEVAGSASAPLTDGVEQLLAGAHPIARLLKAVETPEELSDAAWAELHVAVTRTYGRSLALAMARQKLVLGPEAS